MRVTASSVFETGALLDSANLPNRCSIRESNSPHRCKSLQLAPAVTHQIACCMAEGEGFAPPLVLPRFQLSKLVPYWTRPTFQMVRTLRDFHPTAFCFRLAFAYSQPARVHKVADGVGTAPTPVLPGLGFKASAASLYLPAIHGVGERTCTFTELPDWV